jgi:hypothetical protein
MPLAAKFEIAFERAGRLPFYAPPNRTGWYSAAWPGSLRAQCFYNGNEVVSTGATSSKSVSHTILQHVKKLVILSGGQAAFCIQV